MSLRDELREHLWMDPGVVDALMPRIEAELAKARNEGWQEGFANGQVVGGAVERGEI